MVLYYVECIGYMLLYCDDISNMSLPEVHIDNECVASYYWNAIQIRRHLVLFFYGQYKFTCLANNLED